MLRGVPNTILLLLTALNVCTTGFGFTLQTKTQCSLCQKTKVSTTKMFNTRNNEVIGHMGESTVMNRRSYVQKISFMTFGGVLTLNNQPSFAKEPVTKESMAKAFADVRFELEDPTGGIQILAQAIDEKDWENIKESTKFYDLEFRKAKMVKARKMFPDSDMRGESLQLCNNVTFDLIGINRASRVEDSESAYKYLEELKTDVTKFLEYESKVVIE